MSERTIGQRFVNWTARRRGFDLICGEIDAWPGVTHMCHLGERHDGVHACCCRYTWADTGDQP